VNMAPCANIGENDWENIDYLITTEEHESALPDLSQHTVTVLFLKQDGSYALQPAGGQKTDIPKLNIEGLERTHPVGAEDAFCGTFAAGLHEHAPLAQTLLRAQIAATLTASKPGAYDAFPFSADIDDVLNELSG